MAKPANSANIKRDQEGPDYQAVVGLVRGQLRNNDADQKSIAQDNATIFTRIEKTHGVHKGAAKTFYQIDRMSPEKRTDYLRSLLGLLGIAGYADFDDLVDRMQKPGKNPVKTGGKPAAKGAKAEAPDALERQTRINLKTGWVQRVKESTKDEAALVDEDWEDTREATPGELTAERERVADFDDAVSTEGNVHPFPASKH